MRLLVLGGTAFLGRAVAGAALAAGHDVTCAARGSTGTPPPGARFVRYDRTGADAYDALDGEFDALVDVSSRPSQVRGAVAALRDRVGHFVYVSSASVYTDNATPGQQAATAPIEPAAPPGVDDPAADGYAQYGPCKVACEEAVRDGVGADRAFICRAGLIVGPEDPSDRFTYWPARLSRGGEVLVPGDPGDPVQWVDVRDLAQWLVLAASSGLPGTYDGICPPVPRAEFLSGVAEGVGADPAGPYAWVPHEFLTGQGVNPWAGPKSLPLWLPLPDYAGFLSRNTSDSVAAGLACRSMADTARVTVDWWRARQAEAPADGADPTPARAGLTAEEEAEVLAAWHAAGH